MNFQIKMSSLRKTISETDKKTASCALQFSISRTFSMEINEWAVLLTIFSEVVARNPFAGCIEENTYGYGYVEYFDVDILPKERLDGSEPLDPNAPFYMEFYVRATKNAHILLTEDTGEESGLEILLGGGSNTFCQIRQLGNGRRKLLKTKQMTNTVSGSEDRGFWIEFDSMGNLLVGRKGDSDPFLHYYNRFFRIRYFSFATWRDTRGVWHFACPKNPPPGEDDEERNVTTSQRLRQDLFTFYNPMYFPEKDRNPNQSVNLDLEANSLHLDEKLGKLEITGFASVKWNDWKLQWDPQNYDNIDMIKSTPHMIWTPRIEVLNAATTERTTFLRKVGSVNIKSSGEIIWKEPFISTTLCLLGYQNWPYDKHTCSVIIGSTSEPLKLNIDSMRLTTKIISKWEIQNPEENGTITYIKNKRDTIEFHLRRRNSSAVTQNFLIPPFIGAATLTLLSFWAYPNTFVRLFLCSGSIFLVIVTLAILSHTLPNLLSSETAGFYYLTIFFYCFPMLFFIALNYLPESVNLPQSMKNFFKSRISQILFCFPEIKQPQPGKFSTSEEIECSVNAFLLSILYERITFFIYLVGFITSLAIALVFNEIIV